MSLVATGVVRRFEGLTVLDGVSLTLNPGDRLAVTGPSGSGKSTLLHLLAGLDRPDAGTVTLHGVDLWSGSEADQAARRAQGLGLIFQDHHLLPQATALENVLLPALGQGKPTAAQLDRAHTLLNQVGLEDRAQHLPHALSTGQRQRVAVARALLLSPAVLLADEPTGSLDHARAAELLDLICGVSPDLALLLVTHDPAQAAALDRTLTLREGKLVDA